MRRIGATTDHQKIAPRASEWCGERLLERDKTTAYFPAPCGRPRPFPKASRRAGKHDTAAGYARVDPERPSRRAPRPDARPVEPIAWPQPRVVSGSQTSRGRVPATGEHRRRMTTPRCSDSSSRARQPRWRAAPTRRRTRAPLWRLRRCTWRRRQLGVQKKSKRARKAPPRERTIQRSEEPFGRLKPRDPLDMTIYWPPAAEHYSKKPSTGKMLLCEVTGIKKVTLKDTPPRFFSVLSI